MQRSFASPRMTDHFDFQITNYKLPITNKAGGAVSRLPLSLQPPGFARLDGAEPRPHTSIAYAALLALLGSLPSSVFWLPTFTLICFGLASAFLASLIFNTPLS